jgi:hypothetical protein
VFGCAFDWFANAGEGGRDLRRGVANSQTSSVVVRVGASGQGGQALVVAGVQVGLGPSLRDPKDASSGGGDHSSLSEMVSDGDRTIETGAGFPTLGFLARGTRHRLPGCERHPALHWRSPAQVPACGGGVAAARHIRAPDLVFSASSTASRTRGSRQEFLLANSMEVPDDILSDLRR